MLVITHIASPGTVSEFERDVGLQYLRGMHLNDSKGALGSKKDRHQNIGLYVPPPPHLPVPS